MEIQNLILTARSETSSPDLLKMVGGAAWWRVAYRGFRRERLDCFLDLPKKK